MSSSECNDKIVGAFYALQPMWMTMDRYYKIYVHKDALYGALLGSQIYDAKSAMVQLNVLMIAPPVVWWVNRILRRVQEREDIYDRMDLTSGEFLKTHNHNFCIRKAEIQRTDYRESKSSFWMAGSRISGILRITTHEPEPRKFILVGEQNAIAILAAIGA